MPAPKAKPSRAITLAHLKTLLTRVGGTVSGTKPALAARLQHELAARRLRDGSTRVLSVDMGIKNMAFCVCDVEVGGGSGKGAGSRKGAGNGGGAGAGADDVRIEVVAWKRIAVLDTAQTSDPTTTAAASPLPAAEGADAFVPSKMAGMAYAVLTQLLLPYKPATILIEQQRYRSQNSAAIQEWTYRVNMLEGMLWAVLETLRREQARAAKAAAKTTAAAAAAPTAAGGEGGSAESEAGKPRRGRKKKDAVAAEHEQGQQHEQAFPAVFAVSPSRVGTFWMDTPAGQHAATTRPRRTRSSDPEEEEEVNENDNNDDEEPAEPTPRKKRAAKAKGGKIEKRDKIALVAHWLQTLSSPTALLSQTTTQTPPETAAPPASAPFPDAGLTLAFTHQAAAMRAAFARKQASSRRRPASASASTQLAPTLAADRDAAKLDDLADCLLQAAAWARWEANRRGMVGLGEGELRDLAEGVSGGAGAGEAAGEAAMEGEAEAVAVAVAVVGKATKAKKAQKGRKGKKGA
ncbi:uncharacterized protein K452DRAFT_287011 [Aplosporella prunicola CBS 121167]|uniref:Mitochondrial resolvase Ydc2 catalytic domain-containing protein n=1 Tax=Aplosporella prunicola CBS 121167 TaxID=1176127 RepID=A0A6A6BEK1_9PEZI|nr:uncharacterized protein K452DRAFT_287011 [Aplosporella prunicola CBS 121167]KAF2142592.1 hypothetical protein K452DRAFT_287011 [Aplosporella prunicola CBS 121167]